MSARPEPERCPVLNVEYAAVRSILIQLNASGLKIKSAAVCQEPVDLRGRTADGFKQRSSIVEYRLVTGAFAEVLVGPDVESAVVVDGAAVAAPQRIVAGPGDGSRWTT